MVAGGYGGSMSLSRLMEFLADLERHGLHYTLASSREEAVMVEVATPGIRWEVEFFTSGDIEVERFTSDGHIGGEELLAELWKHAD
jgi:hypothetical protein